MTAHMYLQFVFPIQAAKHNLEYPHFAWIMYGGVSRSYGLNDSEDLSNGCNDETIYKFLNNSRALMMDMLPEPDDEDAPTDTGFVRQSLSVKLCILDYFRYAKRVHEAVVTNNCHRMCRVQIIL